jgi:hypothetical protein
MIDEWPVIEKKITNTNLVFRPMVPVEEIEPADSEENYFGNDSDKIRLSREEYSVYQLVNGQSSVAEIIESSKFGEFHTCKALYDLLERKIIEPAVALPRVPLEPIISIRAQREGIDFVRLAYPILGLLVLGAVFLGIRDPLRIPMYSFFQEKDSGEFKARLNDIRLNQVDSSIMMYFYVHGSLPSRLEELVESNYLRQEDILDAWSRPYLYDVSGDTYILSSAGSGGKVLNRSQIRRRVVRMQETEDEPKSKTTSTIRFETTE